MDHDHETGQVRGLLCRNCNLNNGIFQDSPTLLRNAAEYIERSRRGRMSVAPLQPQANQRTSSSPTPLPAESTCVA